MRKARRLAATKFHIPLSDIRPQVSSAIESAARMQSRMQGPDAEHDSWSEGSVLWAAKSVSVCSFAIDLFRAFRYLIVHDLDLQHQARIVRILLVPLEQRLSHGFQFKFSFLKIRRGYHSVCPFRKHAFLVGV
jgi:hypothetical protein